jgi:hypothetical protein
MGNIILEEFNIIPVHKDLGRDVAHAAITCSKTVEPPTRKTDYPTGQKVVMKELLGQLKKPIISLMTRAISFLDNNG